MKVTSSLLRAYAACEKINAEQSSFVCYLLALGPNNVFSSSGVAEVNSRTIASLECKIIKCCGLSHECVLTSCIPACLGRKVLVSLSASICC